MSTLRHLSLAMAIAVTPLALAQPAAALSPDETARALAGIDAGTPPFDAADEERNRHWSKNAKKAASLWASYEKKIGKKMAAWATDALERTAGETLFYPFSGPDFPTAAKLYPDAGRFVLVALEKAGRVPKLDSWNYKTFKLYMRIFNRGWSSFAKRGFFHTDHMKRDMDEDSLVEGVTPALMAFAKSLGYTVHSVEPMRINAKGTSLEAHPGPRDAVETWDSVRITLKRGGPRGPEVTLDYVHLDVSDGNLNKTPNAKAWITQVAQHRVVTKAASHLMQKPFFSVIRDAILARAPSIWQDETGIDYEQLRETFDVTLYGKFTRANKLWTEGVQRSLATAYERRKDVRPLPFKVGYRKDAGSCVQVATRKAAQ